MRVSCCCQKSDDLASLSAGDAFFSADCFFVALDPTFILVFEEVDRSIIIVLYTLEVLVLAAEPNVVTQLDLLRAQPGPWQVIEAGEASSSSNGTCLSGLDL